MPIQWKCQTCGDRLFYIMHQDDGSVEVFCSRMNHRYVLVNIPELVEHILKADKGEPLEQYKEGGGGNISPESIKAEVKDSLDGAVNIDGAP